MGEFSYIGEAALIAKAMAAVTEAVTLSAEDLVAQAMAATPVDTGTLKASIHVDDITVGALEVTARVATGGESSEYAIPVHEGSGPHIIVPRSKKALAFGGIVVKSVHHPGAAPNKYLEGPLLANRPVYVAAMRRAAAGAF
jgi:hypothetical protein